ncbi:efflux RND transporter permease subunit [Sulfitobacter sabulilitoris]|uniref:Efflux RND transporter permease subunit n=1 Tax=Sulfitobacter sabulilitoris TaxID=2562655 RepID=A0A5S3PC81_9RHOB|nr:efflux RND transporter permease subunit [Sulfitobacter sabulilitoris]TMM51318.1 efflux RND transporter permease subunit [Sulfitobacter sabulilitoris]
MDGLARFGIEKSRFTLLIMVGLIVIGALAYLALPKRENPAITIRTVIVTAQFPGMSPERVEDLIAMPLERAAREIGEVDEIATLVNTGRAQLNVVVADGVPSDELDLVFNDIRTQMEGTAGELPEGTLGPVVNTNYGDVAVATVAVTGDGFSYAEIEDAAEDLQTGLYAIDGITKVSLSGDQEERIWLEIDSRRLAAVGIQLPQLLSDLGDQNVILPAGRIDADGTNIVLEANGNLSSLEEIGGVLTQLPTGDIVRLRDLMTVRRGYVDPPRQPVYFNDEPAVLVSVEMSDDRDIQKLGRTLRGEIARLEQTQPIGIAYNLSTFQETNVTKSINGALSNVAQTFAVVLVVMFVFLGLRPALVIASIVPFTVAFALLGMSQWGIDLEQISIAAVIISLGLLVDNGLVVVEDIDRRIKDGATPSEAATGAGGQFFVPLAVASITTVSAFLPMLVLEGTTGEFAFSLGAVVALMLAGSWLTAHYILPFLAAALLRPKPQKEPREGLLERVYGGLTRRSLRLGIPVVAVCYLLVALGITNFGQLKSEMFPLSERAEFLVYIDLPKGSSITATRDEARAIDAWLRDADANPEVANTTLFVGHGGPRFYLALSPADTDPASAFFVVNTHDFEGAVVAAERTRRQLIANHPAVRGRVTRLSMGGSESGIVEVQITGPDADTLLAAAAEVEAGFDDVPGLTLNSNDWGNKSLTVGIDILQEKARELGVTSSDISNVMQAYFSGAEYSVFRDGTDQIPIVVRAEEVFRDSLEDLANLTIPTDTGLISLDQVARFQPRLTLSQLRRENQVRQITISGKSGTLAATEVEALIAPTLDSLDLGPDYEVAIGGESADAAEANANLLAGMPLALVVMIAALMFQFNSVRRVAITFLTIPLILVGAPLALLITGQPLSFFAILGLISLMGIIINNAIVLIDQIDIERQAMPLDDAIVVAAKKRLNPVLLTSLTTVLGLIPMALFGGALFEPMAALMIGGLLLASPLTLLFVPPLYRLFFLRAAQAQEA